ncbi:MAG: CoA transferase [Rhodospirillales bacterium]|nr:MAG: CoA transferase [Rhodospirillales bacterium]
MAHRDPAAPLAGLRVLDLTRMLAGPFCTALLADLGAEVIKVEAPGRGDDARHFAPFRNGESAYFMMINRGKKGITLNLKDPRGVELLEQLAKTADVLVENFRPGVAARLGVDYGRLGDLNPRLVYASISGFGQTGPLAGRPAYDIVAQAMSGLMSVTGAADGPPMRVGESFGDLCAGLFGAWGILAALHGRAQSGRGQYLDIAMTDSLFAMMVTALSLQLYGDAPPRRIGNRHPMSAPYDSFEARDGHVIIASANDAIFRRLAEAIGRPDLPSDPRFADETARAANEPSLRAVIQEWTASRSVAEAVGAMDAAGVPAAPVLTVAEAVASNHVLARGLLAAANHPVAGDVRLVRQPVRFGDVPQRPPTPSPTLGQHTDELLGELLDPAAIGALRRDGVI